MEVPKRRPQLSVAIPSSLTEEVPHLREKTTLAGLVARSLAIFRVEQIILYNDKPDKKAETEGKLLQKLLNFEETPPYLRKRLFGQDPDLKYVGSLPPLRTPNHPDIATPRTGLLREGIVLESGRVSMVEAGFKVPVAVPSHLSRQDRVTIRLTHAGPRLEGETVDPSRLSIYWGFRVVRESFTLPEVFRKRRPSLKISTSRKGRVLRDVTEDLSVRWKSSPQALVAFGSRKEGVPEILAREGASITEMVDFNLNTIPHQGVETVRTEEALLATLATLNFMEEA